LGLDPLWLSCGIFIATYALLVTERVHRTIVVMLGAGLMIVTGIITQDQAFAGVDFNTISLLTGMMILVGITRRSGIFQFVAVWVVRKVNAEPRGILVLLATITAIFSALFDNVTTVLLIVPVTLLIVEKLDLSPYPFLYAEIFASNIGGTATLIGDPPNIIIGSKVGLTFNQFIVNLAVPVVISLAAVLVYIWLTNKEKFKPIDTNLAKLFSVQLLLEKIRFNYLDIRIDSVFLAKSLACLGLAILFFVTQTFTKLPPGVVALFVAMIPIVRLVLESNPIIGAVSITPDAKVVAAIGTTNIVGLCHINKVPVFLFANSLKFSYHPSSSQRIHTKTAPTSQDDVSYMLTTHSRDILDLKLVDHLVTEDGTIEKPFMGGNQTIRKRP